MEAAIKSENAILVAALPRTAEVRSLGLVARMGTWLADLCREFRRSRIDVDPNLFFPRDI